MGGSICDIDFHSETAMGRLSTQSQLACGGRKKGKQVSDSSELKPQTYK